MPMHVHNIGVYNTYIHSLQVYVNVNGRKWPVCDVMLSRLLMYLFLSDLVCVLTIVCSGSVVVVIVTSCLVFTSFMQ